MDILITGAAGFVGRNLTAALEAIRDGKDRRFPTLQIGKLWLYDMDSSEELLEEACKTADFVFNLAGVNRPKDPAEFMTGNFGFAGNLLDTLRKHHNTCDDPARFIIKKEDLHKGDPHHHRCGNQNDSQEQNYAANGLTAAVVH